MPAASAPASYSCNVHTYWTGRNRCCARSRRRSRETCAACVGAFERHRPRHRQRSGVGRRLVAWQRRLVARVDILTRIGSSQGGKVDGPLINRDVSIFLASLVPGANYILAVRGVELRPANCRDRVGGMHLVVCRRATRCGIHQRSHDAGKQAHSGRGGSAGDRELVEGDAAGGSKFETTLIVEDDDGVAAGAGDDSITDVDANAGRRSDGCATGPLNLDLAVDGLEGTRDGLRHRGSRNEKQRTNEQQPSSHSGAIVYSVSTHLMALL